MVGSLLLSIIPFVATRLFGVTTGVISVTSAFDSALEKITFIVLLSGFTFALDWMFKTLENDAKSIDKPITPTIKATIAITFTFLFLSICLSSYVNNCSIAKIIYALMTFRYKFVTIYVMIVY